MAVFISPTGIECSSADPNFSNSGMPYNLKQTGTVTTNSSGAANVGINNWSWSTFQSYKRSGLVMATFWNDSNRQVATMLLHMRSGDRATYIVQDAYEDSAAWGAYCQFYSNSSAGSRYFQLINASGSRAYNYEFRSVNQNSDFDGYGGF